jgi:hypothetical protein
MGFQPIDSSRRKAVEAAMLAAKSETNNKER